MKSVRVKVRDGLTIRWGKGPKFSTFIPQDEWLEVPMTGYIARRIEEGSLIRWIETPSNTLTENDVSQPEIENKPKTKAKTID